MQMADTTGIYWMRGAWLKSMLFYFTSRENDRLSFCWQWESDSLEFSGISPKHMTILAPTSLDETTLRDTRGHGVNPHWGILNIHLYFRITCSAFCRTMFIVLQVPSQVPVSDRYLLEDQNSDEHWLGDDVVTGGHNITVWSFEPYVLSQHCWPCYSLFIRRGSLGGLPAHCTTAWNNALFKCIAQEVHWRRYRMRLMFYVL